MEKNSKSSETLMETMTKGRVYAVVDRNRVKSIVYFDKENKRSKQIDLDDHHGKNPHVHRGYNHNEYSPNNQPTGLLPKEKQMVESVLATWDNFISKR
ncbi:MAG: hypothetical protein ACI360_08525 [Atopobiaceae bacterium]